MRYIRFFFCLLMLTILNNGCGSDENVTIVRDSSIQPGDQVTWTKDQLYLLDGFVFVEKGAVLTIEPGTVIKAKSGYGAEASALIITVGGRINAEGSATQPIIFTAQNDNVDDPHDLPRDASGLWGGIIILGAAKLNTATGTNSIEGIPRDDPRGMYGGNDDDDDSGILRYVSIRYGGTDIGRGNEINGLTLGGVGRETLIEYVEIFNNRDDGFEFFGGTVQTRYLISAFNGDDAFDYDEGFRGKGQFWFSIQHEDFGNHAVEMDGGTTPVDGQPYAVATIWNSTFIGSGANSANLKNRYALNFRDNAGGLFYNCIFYDFPEQALVIEDVTGRPDSRERLEAGDIVFKNTYWFRFNGHDQLGQIVDQDFARTYLLHSDLDNVFADPKLKAISRLPNGTLAPFSSRRFPSDPDHRTTEPFFQETDFVGAFGDTNWAKGWTMLDHLDFFADETD